MVVPVFCLLLFGQLGLASGYAQPVPSLIISVYDSDGETFYEADLIEYIQKLRSGKADFRSRLFEINQLFAKVPRIDGEDVDLARRMLAEKLLQGLDSPRSEDCLAALDYLDICEMNDRLWSRLELLLGCGSKAQQSASLSCLSRMRHYRAEQLLYARFKDTDDPALRFAVLKAIIYTKNSRLLRPDVEFLSRESGPYQAEYARILKVYFSPE